jgi:RecB family exonuclease
VSVPQALRRVLAGEHAGALDITDLAIDAALLDDDAGAFAWRRLANLIGLTLHAVDLGAIETPLLDFALIEGMIAFLRFATSERDGDARRAIVTRASGVPLDEARALLVAAGERGSLLETIAAGKIALGTDSRARSLTFAHNLTTIARAYAAPEPTAANVLAAVVNAFVFDHAPTVAALTRIARDFDAARTFAPWWNAEDLIAEIVAECNDFGRLPSPPFARASAPALAPEPARAVPLRRTHFSASSLNTYAECARKWYFRYACAAVEDRGSSASFYGTAFHAALEEFHLTYPRIENIAPEELANRLDADVGAAFERFRDMFDAPVEYELQRRRARRTAKKYLAWMIERAAREPYTVIGCETSTELEIAGQPFVGYIDRLDRDDRSGGVTVFDYKTGAIATSAAAYRDDVAAFREFQLPFYYWSASAAGHRVTKLALVPLKDPFLDVAPIVLEVVPSSPRAGRARGRDEQTTGPIGIDDLERARTRMGEIATTLANADLTAYPATDDPDACYYCAYRDACRDRPLATAERFGR